MMKKTIYSMPKSMTVTEIKQDQIRVKVPFYFDNSGIILARGRTQT